ncbi:MAG: FtsW/RodA/SpoVE family cell cycle protein [Actinobacteria bacterium]|nr:FtsW/RodA/SpoVE family cell cycle protein [Actinomycetota bacterium]NBY15924.1 FtsW/RodA/SpoVE family cell cycle protein [Actinomycetota bacterium]
MTQVRARKISTRRSAEGSALVLAWLIGAFAWVLVDLATDNDPTSAIVPLLIVGGLLLIAHVTVRWQAPYADPVILPTVAMLNLLGLAMIHRLDVANQRLAEVKGTKSPTPDVYLQITWLAVGLLLFCSVLWLVGDHRRLQKLTFTCGVAGVVLLFLPLIPGLGVEINGARLWINLAIFTIQPGEVAKILLTIFFAGFLVTRRHSLALISSKVIGIGLPRPKDAGPLLVVWLAALLVLILERDLGTSLLIFGLFVVVLYVSTGRRSWVILGATLLSASSLLAYQAFGHVRIRFSVWLDPFSQSTDNGYQIVQSLYGFANGGVFGTGWGRGYPQLVPFAKTDFITSALGEELGLTGLIAIILLYILLIERGARAAVATRDQFGNLLAMGLTATIGLQTFIVIGGVTRLIPLTGLTTPFLSYGGSSLVANYILVALLLRISNAARKPESSDLSVVGLAQ